MTLSPVKAVSRHSIVVTLLEGRNFSKSKNHLYVQTNFNNEILTTDPIKQTPTPIFDTELVWFVTHKQLSFLKSQRKKLKLNVYSIDHVENERVMLGYIILDLRSALVTNDPVEEKWYRLVNLQEPSHFKPEIKLSFYISLEKSMVQLADNAQMDHRADNRVSFVDYKETNHSTANAHGIFNINAANQSPSSHPVSVIGESHWTFQKSPEPKSIYESLGITLVNGEYYQIGPVQTNQEFYSISITISFIENLDVAKLLLMPSNEYRNRFYFSYEFLQHAVKTREFGCVSNQFQFPVETWKFTFRATRADFLTFLETQKEIDIKFVYENKILGHFTLELVNVLFLFKEKHLDKVYPLILADHQEVDEFGNVAGVGVSISLSIGNQSQENHLFKNDNKEKVKSDIQLPPFVKAVPVVEQPVLLPQAGQTKPKMEQPDLASNRIETKTIRTETNNTNIIETTLNLQENQSYRKLERIGTYEEDLLERDWHQYRLSIEFRSIKHLSVPNLTNSSFTNVLFKYNYRPFHADDTVTKPTRVPKNAEKALLEHSFYSFEFIMTSHELLDYFTNLPLVIEMYAFEDDVENHGDGDRIKVGECVLDLNQLLLTPKRVTSESDIHSFDKFVKVSTKVPKDGIDRVCDLQSIVAIEDFGILNNFSGTRYPSPQKEDFESEVDIPTKDTNFHSQAYEASIELELWKQEQKKQFLAQLKEKEEAELQKLASQNQEIQSAQTQTFELKLKKYQDLLSNLEKLNKDLTIREQKIKTSESEIERLQQTLHQEIIKQRQLTHEQTQKFNTLKEELEMEYSTKQSRQSAELLKLEREKEQYRNRLMEYELKTGLDVQKTTNQALELQKAVEDCKNFESKCRSLVESRHVLKKKYIKVMDMYKALVSEHEKCGKVEKSGENDMIRKDLSELKEQVEKQKQKLAVKHDPELIRLQKEKDSLLACGYLPSDQLIMMLEQKINSIQVSK